MSVKIEQLNLIKMNDYNKMIIRKTNDGYKVTARRHGERMPQISASRKRAKFFEGLSDKEKIEYLIDHFLNYNTLNCVSKNILIPYYDDVYTYEKCDKELYFNLKEQLQKEMMTKVKEKYYSDRLKTIEENSDINYYTFKLGSVTSYNIVKDNYFGKCIEFCLLGYKKELNSCICVDEEEESFFRKMVEEKLQQEGEEATVDNKNLFNEEDENYINLGYYITCGNTVIDIDSDSLFMEAVNIVDNYNKERKDTKIKKLKMEEM